MPQGKIVYIIGFMGSGKTTAGRKLAALLGCRFIDLDRLIEEKAGMSIPEIFSTYGETWFRELESASLKSISNQELVVVATGGGAPCSGDNMDFMLTNGITVYLRLSPGQLQSRLESAKEERPLIRGMKGDELLEYVSNKLNEREKYYSKARVIVDGFNPDIRGLYNIVRDIL